MASYCARVTLLRRFARPPAIRVACQVAAAERSTHTWPAAPWPGKRLTGFCRPREPRSVFEGRAYFRSRVIHGQSLVLLYQHNRMRSITLDRPGFTFLVTRNRFAYAPVHGMQRP